MLAFKQTLAVSVEKSCKIGRETREQYKSSSWFGTRKYRITASTFGFVLSHKPESHPDKLVLQIVKHKSFFTCVTRYGLENEKNATTAYISYLQSNDHPEIVVH